ncbi:CPA1 family monovalent cation:H+ antiporter [Chitinophaga dinghuensis]|uniref:CPA1 family monovalent cation:H+ antiporter n=1 Tax=Chitinophaga dinghuensis TaxID=1539050 RepID=A0A327WCD6_9BACT|nr:Na+/H+ antiporter [Chitinophaga dinghuensis]RAJ88273.1 CPA1 family monovalent cation:H+ antiporter [Chitinophaga dinghuensis]
MENYSIVLFLLGVMIALSAMADKIRLPYPVLLIVAGIAIGFIPSLPQIELNPEIVFLLFLPPLLYDAAFNISFEEFKVNINTISTLAISLVFITATGIAVMAHYIIPGMTWPLAFVLGSVLSATDAVAAMSITKGLGLTHKTMTILEGESLVNDASALVAYRFAVAAVTGTAFVFWKASLEFIVLMAGGVLVGFVMGKILAFLLYRLRENYLVTISFMLLMPFITYLLAEELHVSGVIAVVILGLGIARFSKKIFPENLKHQSKSIWDIIIFLLNGLIFILIGLELPYVLRGIDAEHVWLYVFYAFLAVVVAFVLRMVRVFMQKNTLQRAFSKKSKRVSEGALLDWKTSLIITWSGMRGIVSLATALALPRNLEDGTPFPERNIIIFIAVVAVLITLIGQGLTLPWLVRTIEKRPVKAA